MSISFECALSDEQLEFFEREGYLIVHELFSATEVAELREHFMALHTAGPVEGWFNPVPLEYSGGDLLRHYPRVVHPHRFDEASRRWMLDARFGSIMCDLFGEEAFAAQSMFYFKPPGARGQALHQDDFYLRTQPGACIASWLAVDAADRENVCCVRARQI